MIVQRNIRCQGKCDSPHQPQIESYSSMNSSWKNILAEYWQLKLVTCDSLHSFFPRQLLASVILTKMLSILNHCNKKKLPWYYLHICALIFYSFCDQLLTDTISFFLRVLAPLATSFDTTSNQQRWNYRSRYVTILVIHPGHRHLEFFNKDTETTKKAFPELLFLFLPPEIANKPLGVFQKGLSYDWGSTS